MVLINILKSHSTILNLSITQRIITSIKHQQKHAGVLGHINTDMHLKLGTLLYKLSWIMERDRNDTYGLADCIIMDESSYYKKQARNECLLI